MMIKIPRDLLSQLLKHVSESRPYEAVAFLLGRKTSMGYEALELVKVSNAARSQLQFYVDPVELYSVYKEADSKGLEVVAIAHSHPGTPYPSSLDRAYMKINPYVWIIVSMYDLKLQAYILEGDELKSVSIYVV